jgi:hypothetical protein
MTSSNCPKIVRLLKKDVLLDNTVFLPSGNTMRTDAAAGLAILGPDSPASFDQDSTTSRKER